MDWSFNPGGPLERAATIAWFSNGGRAPYPPGVVRVASWEKALRQAGSVGWDNTRLARIGDVTEAFSRLDRARFRSE